MKKNTVDIQLDYLELDKCKDDKERAAKLLSDIDRRKDELAQVKKLYEDVRTKIIDDLKESIVNKYPNMDFSAHYPGEYLCTKVMVEKLQYYLAISGSSKKLECDIYLDIEDCRKGAKMSKAFISEFKDMFAYYTPIYKMSQDFDRNDFDGAFACFEKALEMLLLV